MTEAKDQVAPQEGGQGQVRAAVAPRNPWLPLLIVSIGFFMVLLDGTIVNVAIPTMLTSLHATFDQILWVINAYTVVLAALLITAGRVGDILGPRTVFVTGLIGFTLASVICGLSQDANQLIGARVLQGIGAATMSPQVLVIASSLFPPERRGTALGVVASVTALATIAGQPWEARS
jgi:MFS family permease